MTLRHGYQTAIEQIIEDIKIKMQNKRYETRIIKEEIKELEKDLQVIKRFQDRQKRKAE